jgi:hypothetical protein
MDKATSGLSSLETGFSWQVGFDEFKCGSFKFNQSRNKKINSIQKG